MSDLGPRPTRPDVVVEQRPDPDRPDRGRTQHTIRGARRYDGVLSLFGANSSEYRAAERYRDDNAIAAGVRLTERSMVRSASPTAHEPSAAVLDALMRARGHPTTPWGAPRCRWIIWTVLANQSLRQRACARRTRHGASAANAAPGVGSAADHYDTLTKRERS